MKVIDLLNKIANGEEVPKKVRYNNEIYDTKSSNNFSLMIYEALGKMYNDDEMQLFINNEIKIIEDKIEEEKKIPEKLSTWFSVEISQNREDNIEYANVNFKNMYEKINEICDYLKNKGE